MDRIFGPYASLAAVIVGLLLSFSSCTGGRVSPWNLQRHWVSANFGSTLAAPPVFSDFNRDGHLDAVILSFDGELIVLDATGHGEALPNTDWPAYHHGHHFFSAPILFDVDRDGVEEIMIVSFNGSIFAYTWRGLLLNSTNLSRFFVKKDKLVSPESELLNFLNGPERRKTEPSLQLQPEVYSTPLLVDWNADGRMEELVFVTNYGVLQRKSVEKDHNLLFGTTILFNLTSFSTVLQKFTDVGKRQSEFPVYFLSDPVLFTPPGKSVHVTAASTSGKLYVWRGPKLEVIPGFPYMYGSSTQPPSVIWPNGTAAIVILDFSGNILALDLNGKEIWERTVKGAPTAARRWFSGKQEALVMGTNKGYVYALNASDGRPLPNFPAPNPGLRFSSAPLMMTNRDGRELAGFLGLESDRMVVMDLARPNTSFRTNFFGERSHLGPSLLPYKLADGCSLFLPFTDGAVGCYSPQTEFHAGKSSAFQIVELFPYQTLSIYAGADFRYGGTGSKLVVFSEMITVILHISDKCPGNHYKLRIYLSGHLVHNTEFQRAGFHYVTFNLRSESHGLLMLELESLLNGELVRDHLWLEQASFAQRYEAFLTTFVVIFCLVLVALVSLHAWRHRSSLVAALEWCDYVRRWLRRIRRQFWASPDSYLPLCHRPTASFAEKPPWRRPCSVLFRVVKKGFAAGRRLFERVFSSRKQRLY